MNTHLQHVAAMRASYRRVRDALPWLDVTVRESELAAFNKHAHALPTPAVKAITLNRDVAGGLATRCKEAGARLAFYDPASCPPLSQCSTLLSEAAAVNIPLVVRHTDATWQALTDTAQAHPDLRLIVESGPRKLLYHITALQELLTRCPNTSVSTYNLCNWLGLEQLSDAGLGSRLLYGSHWPAYNPDVAMGPIVMGRMSWETKCDIAGNNLRRLLDEPVVTAKPVDFKPGPPVVIDTHTHNFNHCEPDLYGFPTPDRSMRPADWLRFMDDNAMQRLLLMPSAALMAGQTTSLEASKALREAAPDRFAFLEIFDPRKPEAHHREIRRSLDHLACVGLKVHPSFHQTPADDDGYAPAFALAHASGKPLLSHTWERSSYNPSQELSHPSRFARHLSAYPRVKLILGHAGGRPSALGDAVDLCRAYPAVMVDIAGDYFHNGLLETLAESLGEDRILFGSDVNWIDPRCVLAGVLGADLSDAGLLAVLRGNALRTFGLAAH